MKVSMSLIAAGLMSSVLSVAAFAQTNGQNATQPAAPTTSAPAQPGTAGLQHHNQNMASKNMASAPTKAADQHMSTHRVEEIQAALQGKGEQVAVDGIWGPKTTAALKDFQKKNGLSTSGRFDHKTAQKLSIPHWQG